MLSAHYFCNLHYKLVTPAISSCAKNLDEHGEFPSDFTVLTFNHDNGHTPAGILTYLSVSINCDKGRHQHTIYITHE
jgi:hypothetical protein